MHVEMGIQDILATVLGLLHTAGLLQALSQLVSITCCQVPKMLANLSTGAYNEADGRELLLITPPPPLPQQLSRSRFNFISRQRSLAAQHLTYSKTSVRPAMTVREYG